MSSGSSLWESLWDLGAERKVESSCRRHRGGNPVLRRSIESYLDGLEAWLQNISSELGVSDPVIIRVMEFYGPADRVYPLHEDKLFDTFEVERIEEVD